MVRSDHSHGVGLFGVEFAGLFSFRLHSHELDTRFLCAQCHRVQQLRNFFALRNQLLQSHHVLLINCKTFLQLGTAARCQRFRSRVLCVQLVVVRLQLRHREHAVPMVEVPI